MKLRHYKIPVAGFSLTELLVVLIISALLVSGLFMFLKKQRGSSVQQRLIADTESLAQIAFFIIGRDIRRAGSNPAGVLGSAPGTDLAIPLAAANQIELKADLSGDGIIDPALDEDITYSYTDSDMDGIPDQVVRQAGPGSSLVIKDIRAFDLSYQLVGTNVFVSSTNSPSLIRVVRLHMKAGTGRIDPDTGREHQKEVQMDFMLRNFR
ncbi:MAG: prepilin-type N-terminal cleavage/methylation domain-containing protein [Pseudomonadota bacterium]